MGKSKSFKGGRDVFCPNCGKKRELENRFCTSCGEKLEESIREGNGVQAQGSVEASSKKSISLNLNKKVLGIIAVLLIGGFFVFKGMSANTNSPEGVVQTFLTAIDEGEAKKMFDAIYFGRNNDLRQEALEEVNDPELAASEMANIKDEYTSNLGKDFARPDNIEVVDIEENKFEVYLDYTTSYNNGDSKFDEFMLEAVLDDGQYYVNIFGY